MGLSLTKLLFENQSLSGYALFVHDDTLILVNSQRIIELVKQQKTSKLIFAALKYEASSYVAGMITVQPSPAGTCDNASQVKFVVGNKQFPGMGKMMYALASKYFNVALTSDREHSTTTKAKGTWNKISQDPSFKMMKHLDNFFGQRYLDINKDWSWSALSGPRTPEKEDDCPLPKQADDYSSAVRYLGTPESWKYIGSLDPTSLIEQGKQLLNWLAQTTNSTPATVSKALDMAAFAYFQDSYTGPEE